MVNKTVLRLHLKESAVWRSDGGRLFQDNVYVKARYPAEEILLLVFCTGECQRRSVAFLTACTDVAVKTGREVLWSRVVHALVSERAGLVVVRNDTNNTTNITLSLCRLQLFYCTGRSWCFSSSRKPIRHTQRFPADHCDFYGNRVYDPTNSNSYAHPIIALPIACRLSYWIRSCFLFSPLQSGWISGQFG